MYCTRMLVDIMNSMVLLLIYELKAGMRLVQLAVFNCTGVTSKPYRGRYQGQMGPVGPRAEV
jgi:deoxycytidine triphosphate deaminase